MRRASLALTLAGIASCSESAVDATLPLPPPPPPAPQFHIEPANPFLLLGGSLQLRAVLPNGAIAGAFWRMDEPTAGTLTASGLFTPATCSEVGTVHVHAVWQADTARVASTTITLLQTAVGIVTISAINRVSDGGPAPIDSLTGAIQIRVGIAGIPSQCTEVSELRLVLEGLTITTLGSASFDPPRSGPAVLTFPWNTADVPNGSYRLKVLYRQPGRNLDADGFIPVQIRNP